MTADETGFDMEVSRRKLLAAAGLGSGVLLASSLGRASDAHALPVADQSPDPAGTPAVSGLHLQFGAEASSEVTISWHALQPVRNPAGGAGPAGRPARTDR